MKKNIIIAIAFLLCCFLCACAKDNSKEQVRVFIESGEHYSIEVCAKSVEQGGEASFYIDTDPGYSVVETDYRGKYTLTETQGLTKLVLENVEYPTRVSLVLSFDSRTITYEANGGTALSNVGKTVTKKYDVAYHIRPNVSIGTDLFVRTGYTLTGWNTKADGSGTSVGLGSRMTVDDSVTLYAQWAEWTDAEEFKYSIEEGCVVIYGYKGDADRVVIPETIRGLKVEIIAANAFKESLVKTVILPKTIKRVEENAFADASLRELHFFDNIEFICDNSFVNCPDFSTVYVSAIEDPFGFAARRESVWADKIDLLMTTMGEKRILFYGGCSMWYNLIGTEAQTKVGDDYRVLNMGLNGVVSSLMQMEIIKHYVTENDILVHTPEIASTQQLMKTTGLYTNDTKLWCGIEYNYDMLTLLDIRVFETGFFDSLNEYLGKKESGGSYTDIYHDSKGREYLDKTLSIPYVREEPADSVTDKVDFIPEYFDDLSRLEEEYAFFTDKGVTIYVSFASIDLDEVPKEHKYLLDEIGEKYNDCFNRMEGVTAISDIHDYVFSHSDFYDTVYHLLTNPALRCTYNWLRDLEPYISEHVLQ